MPSPFSASAGTRSTLLRAAREMLGRGDVAFSGLIGVTIKAPSLGISQEAVLDSRNGRIDYPETPGGETVRFRTCSLQGTGNLDGT